MSSRPPVKLTDPKSIRALAHPARLTVIEELYGGRELTATECAELAGLSPSAMSYHLRSLERVGIVERAESTGDGRERPWRSAGSSLEVESGANVGAAAALSATVLSRLGEQFAEWLARRPVEDRVWQEAATVAAGQVWLLPDEVKEIADTVEKHIDSFRGRTSDDRPAGARRVRFAMFAFPSDKPAAQSQ